MVLSLKIIKSKGELWVESLKEELKSIIRYELISILATIITKIIDVTRFERARLISARALQLSMGAPPLIKTKEMDAIEIAKQEFEKDAIPITVDRN